MKTVFIAIAVALYVAAAGHGQPVVTLDSLGGDLVCGRVSQFSGPFTQYVAITNPDAVQTELRLVFSFHIDAGQTLRDFQVQFLNGFEVVFGFYGTVVSHVEQQGSAIIVTVYANTNMPSLPGGLPIHDFPVTYLGISFSLGYERLYGTEQLIIDSCSSPTYGNWYFSSGTAPSFGGPAAWPVFESLPNCGTTIANPPETPLIATPCSPLQYDFNFGDPCYWPARFELSNAPAGATIDPTTGLYSWQPGPEHVGQQFSMTVEVYEDLCAGPEPHYRVTDGAAFTIVVDDCGPPQFVSGQPNTFVTTSDGDLHVTMLVSDPDPVNIYTYSWYVSIQDPVPPCELNPSTGDFHYLGTPADTNLYQISLVIAEGAYADTTAFQIYHYDTYVCGDINHFGGITVADLTWLVSYLFRGGLAPVTLLAGDVDCSGDIKIADLTYLVAFLFRGGPAPCAGCS